MSIRCDVVRGAALSQGVLDEMYRCRCRYFASPRGDEEGEAQRRFERRVREAQKVMLYRERASGRLKGMVVLELREIEAEGLRGLAVLASDGFTDVSFRGQPLLLLSGVTAGLDIWWATLYRDVFFAGVAYLPSFIGMEKYLWPVLTERDELDALERAALEAAVSKFGGERYDPGTGLVDSGMPRAMPPGWFERVAGRASTARYLAMCPDWDQGYTLPIVVRLRPRHIIRLLAAVPKRALRRRLRR